MGKGDSLQGNPEMDNLLLYLGLQLSNVQVLNMRRTLQSTDLESLSVCISLHTVCIYGTGLICGTVSVGGTPACLDNIIRKVKRQMLLAHDSKFPQFLKNLFRILKPLDHCLNNAHLFLETLCKKMLIY